MKQRLSRKKILITGGLGFIGAFLAKRLAEAGSHVVIVDMQKSLGSVADALGVLSLENVQVVEGDLLDDTLYHRLPLDCDAIVHAAGILGIKRVSKFPLLTADVNVFGTRKVLDFATRCPDLQRFVHFSSSEVYGKRAQSICESDPSIIPNIGTRWIYASSKHFSEYLLKAFIQEKGLDGVIVRPFNVYGPYRQGSNAMTTLIRQALEGETITITGDGSQSRCWCYIDDFIDGVVSCLECQAASGQAFNLGNSQEPTSMYALAKKICQQVQSSSSIKILHNEDDDVELRSPDISRAHEALGYQPETMLDDGIQHVANWLSSSLLPA
ncbi:MAG: dTDP-glucose 4,6-dehydratase 2 [Chlamydiales bacterium]|nr:dTDP-glucose 4,6-dehydratase 2 [Chlamydiales bacterium]MCH9620244.1 dTDP-glucose 4,6-dehydratase 2 [Chlamydiales bacterium]MCH9622846.1 dTDP-glucose 4,6-dehydratase 2 [Chlamydiales bacterium]